MLRNKMLQGTAVQMTDVSHGPLVVQKSYTSCQSPVNKIFWLKPEFKLKHVVYLQNILSMCDNLKTIICID